MMEIVKRKLKSAKKKLQDSIDKLSNSKLELKIENRSLVNLDDEIYDQIVRVLHDSEIIVSAKTKLELAGEQFVRDCYKAGSSCLRTYKRWSALWPALHLWQASESQSILSVSTASTLHGIVGEWRALRSVALAMKHMNSEHISSVEGLREPLTRLHTVLRGRLGSLGNNITAVTKEIRGLEIVRRRLRSLLLELSRGLEKDAVHCRVNTDRMLLCGDSLRLDEFMGSLLKNTLLSEQAGPAQHAEAMNDVAAALRELKGGSESELDKLSDNFVDTWNSSLLYSHDDLLQLECLRDSLTANTCHSARTAMGARPSTSASLHPHSKMTHFGGTSFHVSKSNAEDSTSAFNGEKMSMVLESMEFRLALRELQWVASTCNREFCLQQAHNISSDESIYHLQEIVDQHVANFNEWLSYRTFSVHLSNALRLPHGAPFDWLCRQAIAASRIISGRAPLDGTVDTSSSSQGSSTSASDATRDFKRSRNSGIMASSSRGGYGDKIVDVEGSQRAVRAFQRSALGREAPAVHSAKVKRQLADALQPVLTADRAVDLSELDKPTMRPSDLANARTVDDDEDEYNDDDEDGSEGGDIVSELRSTAAGSASQPRGESLRKTMIRVLNQDAHLLSNPDKEDYSKAHERILTKITARVDGAKEAMNVTIGWLVEAERLRITVMSINGAEEFMVYMSQQDIETVFKGNADLQAANMNNAYLCQAIIDRLRVERIPRSAAYNLVVATKSGDTTRRLTMSVPAIDISGSEDDAVKMLTIRNNDGALQVCAIAKFKVANLEHLAKIIPKREVHAGSVEALLNKQKAKATPGRATVF